MCVGKWRGGDVCGEVEEGGVRVGGDEPTHTPSHTPSTAFRHLPPNSARFSYATERALFISAQLSTDAVSALRKGLGTDKTVEAT